jgi:hypothetical protein
MARRAGTDRFLDALEDHFMQPMIVRIPYRNGPKAGAVASNGVPSDCRFRELERPRDDQFRFCELMMRRAAQLCDDIDDTMHMPRGRVSIRRQEAGVSTDEDYGK